MVQLLDFINRNSIKQSLWKAFYGNCGMTWEDLYGSTDTNEIKKDHITIWWDKNTMDETMFKWMISHRDHLTINGDGEIMFHFYIQ